MTDSTAIPPATRSVSRHSIPAIIAELWGARDLVMQFVMRDITVRYTQAVMGFAWALLMPLLIVGAGTVFRIAVSTLSSQPVEGFGIASLAVKALLWAFFSAGLQAATLSILAHANLLGKVYFPREALPIATVLAQCLDLSVGLVVLAIALPFFGVPLTWNLLWAPLLLVLLISFTIGCALILSCANLFYRDVKYIVQVLLNFGVFATPVFFEPQMLGVKGAAIMLRLPLSPFIQGIDLAVVRGHNLLQPLALATPKGLVDVWSPWLLAYAATTSILLLFGGLRMFRTASRRFAEMA